MFKNHGKKIKDLADILCMVQMILAGIAGFALMSEGDEMLWVGIGVLAGGIVFAYVSSLLLSGFGQLIENSDVIATEYRARLEAQEAKAEENAQYKQKQNIRQVTVAMQNPQIREDDFVNIICPHCKAGLSYTKEHLRSKENLVCPMCDKAISISF